MVMTIKTNNDDDDDNDSNIDDEDNIIDDDNIGDNGFQSVRVQRNQRRLWPREISLASAIYKIRPHLWRRLFEIQNTKLDHTYGRAFLNLLLFTFINLICVANFVCRFVSTKYDLV